MMAACTEENKLQQDKVIHVKHGVSKSPKLIPSYLKIIKMMSFLKTTVETLKYLRILFGAIPLIHTVDGIIVTLFIRQQDHQVKKL